jgi:CBS domain-containing protein
VARNISSVLGRFAGRLASLTLWLLPGASGGSVAGRVPVGWGDDEFPMPYGTAARRLLTSDSRRPDMPFARYNQVLDVSRDDLADLLAGAEMEGYRRRLGQLRCKYVMSRQVISVEFGTPLLDAWNLMKAHRIKSLPVTDRVRRVVGIVTQSDYLRFLDQTNYLAL